MNENRPDSEWTSLEIDSFWSGERLDVVIFRVFDFLPSRSFAAKWIDAGFVRLARSGPKPGLRVRIGDVVEVCTRSAEIASVEPLAEQMNLDILFEDDDLIVLNKPAGLVVHPGAGVPSGTLVNALFAHCGQTLPSLGQRARAGIVHRLDRDTSGVMVAAKSQKALTGLSEQFAAHTQLRRYVALCYGVLNQYETRLETGYGRDPHARTKFKVLPAGEGKRAATTFKVTRSFGGGVAAEVECALETGRTHQIRVHLTSLGCPLIGDVVYGLAPPSFAKRFPQLAAWMRKTLGGQMLHAQVLGFQHPVTGRYLEFEAPLRHEMIETIERLKLLDH